MATLISGLGGVAGYGEQSLRTLGVTSGNLDDGSRFVDATSVFGPSGINFYGTNYTGFHLNTNGILTFNSAYTVYTPSTALTAVGQPNIAGFWTDIDINKGGEIYWDLDPASGRIVITWLDARGYTGPGTNSFQIVLSNLGGGDLGVQYIYGSIGYTGSGGGAATVGLSNGSTLQTLAEGSSNATIIAGYATNDFDTNDAAGVWGVNFEGGTLQTGNGVVDGTAGGDLINSAYTGDPQGDRVDNWDANGFSGTSGHGDYILAGAGNDTVMADLGNDQVFGGTGNDQLFGGQGSDSLDGGTENDSIDGGSGNDTLIGGTGDDTLFGGSASTAVNYTASFTEVTAAHQVIAGTSGRPNFFVRSVSSDGAANLTTGVAGTNGAISGFLLGDVDRVETHTHTASSPIQSSQINFNGIDGNETLTIFIDGVAVNLNTLIASGAVTFNGSSGTYSIDALGRIVRTGGAATSTNVGSLVINIAHTSVSLVSAGTTGTVGMFYEYFVNTAPVNVAAENGGNDSILGDAGNDQIFGGDGNDTLNGGGDQDTLDGGIGNDSLLGNVGDDSILGQAGNDSLFGGDGNDTLDGGADDDTLDGGVGDDSLYGNSGNDSVLGQAGNDRIFGGDGNDTLYGGDGNDTLYGGDGNDLIEYGVGDDTVYGGSGDDTIDDVGGIGSGTGNNLIYAGLGNDQIWDGSGNDTVYGGDGNDRFDGDNAGNDQVFGEDGNDTLTGGAGSDTLDGGTDHDQLFGGGDADHLLGGLGNDLLDGGAGNDTLIGDTGNDTFAGGDGADLIFGGAGDVVVGGEGGTDNDTLRINSDFYRIIYGGGGNEGGTVQFLDGFGGNVIGSLTFSEIENVMCFTPGARIQTARGQVLVEKLRHGDLVMTRDHGLQAIRWVGRRDLGFGDLIANPALRPVRIRSGALGGGLPKRDLTVSPQHRMLMGGAKAEMLFGEDEVLVAAIHMTTMDGVEQVLPRGVSYIHIMFDRHEIISAEGAWSESFQPSDRNLAEMDQPQRDEIATLFSAQDVAGSAFAAARLSLKSYEAKALLSVAN